MKYFFHPTCLPLCSRKISCPCLSFSLFASVDAVNVCRLSRNALDTFRVSNVIDSTWKQWENFMCSILCYLINFIDDAPNHYLTFQAESRDVLCHWSGSLRYHLEALSYIVEQSFQQLRGNTTGHWESNRINDKMSKDLSWNVRWSFWLCIYIYHLHRYNQITHDRTYKTRYMYLVNKNKQHMYLYEHFLIVLGVRSIPGIYPTYGEPRNTLMHQFTATFHRTIPCAYCCEKFIVFFQDAKNYRNREWSIQCLQNVLTHILIFQWNFLSGSTFHSPATDYIDIKVSNKTKNKMVYL